MKIWKLEYHDKWQDKGTEVFATQRKLLRSINDDYRVDWLNEEKTIGQVVYYSTIVATITATDNDGFLEAQAPEMLKTLQRIKKKLSGKDGDRDWIQEQVNTVLEWVTYATRDFPIE